MLEIKELSISGRDHYALLEQVSLQLAKGQCIGLTGASGSGKTSLIKAVMGVSDNSTRLVSGSITLDGNSLHQLSVRARRSLCGRTFGFIPQNPMVSFNRHKKIAVHMCETFKCHLSITRDEGLKMCRQVLEKVNLNPERVLALYPDQVSGGMLQRVTIAISLGLAPEYIFADEPTAALDEENKEMVIKLFKENYKESGCLFLSHDVKALKMLCDKIAVMNNGRIIEMATPRELFESPQAAWTKRFVSAMKEQKEAGWQWEKLN